jgi:hypothetical protein
VDQGRGRQGPDLTVPDPGAPATSRATARRFPLPLGSPLVWHLVSLALGALFLMYVSRNQWFFGDEWDFFADSSVGVGDQGLFAPHNEHWSTAPMLIYGLLFRLTGLTSYAPYMAVVVVAHLAVVHLAWRIALRGGVHPWIATAFCAAFIPFGPGADNLLWAFQIGFVGSVAFGLGAILIADHPRGGRRRDAAGWVTSVVGLTFSGITVPLVAASAIAAWMRRGFKAFLITVSVPAAVYLVWLLTAGREGIGGIAPVTVDSLRVFPEFVRRGVAAVLSVGTPTILTGGLPLLLTGAAIVLRRRRGRPLPYAAIAAAVGEVLLLLMLAIGRAPFGLEAADATRYVHIAGALLLPLLLIGLSDLAGRRAVAVLLVAALAIPWGIHNARLLIHLAELQAERERVIREQIWAAGTLFDPSTVLRTRPEPVYTLDLHLSELERLLPAFPKDIEPSQEAVLRAALALQFSAGSRPEFSTSVDLFGVRAFDAVLVPPPPDGCAEARPEGAKPRVAIPVGPPGSIALVAAVPFEVEGLISARGVRPDYTGFLELEPGRPLFLNMAIDEGLVGQAEIIVRFPHRIQLCPVDVYRDET